MDAQNINFRDIFLRSARVHFSSSNTRDEGKRDIAIRICRADGGSPVSLAFASSGDIGTEVNLDSPCSST
jgi:hypothetical protein